jgi:hypothetical protein
MAVIQAQGIYSYNLNRYSLVNFQCIPTPTNPTGDYRPTISPTVPLLGSSSGDTVLNFVGTLAGNVILPTAASILSFFRATLSTQVATGITSSGTFYIIKNSGTVNLTILPPTGVTIEKGSSYVIKPGGAAQIFFDGISNWFVAGISGSSGTSGTSGSSGTSGTSGTSG